MSGQKYVFSPTFNLISCPYDIPSPIYSLNSFRPSPANIDKGLEDKAGLDCFDNSLARMSTQQRSRPFSWHESGFNHHSKPQFEFDSSSLPTKTPSKLAWCFDPQYVMGQTPACIGSVPLQPPASLPHGGSSKRRSSYTLPNKNHEHEGSIVNIRRKSSFHRNEAPPISPPNISITTTVTATAPSLTSCNPTKSNCFNSVNISNSNNGNSNSRTMPHFKTEFCVKFRENGYCSFGDRCQFVHYDYELQRRARALTYKTRPCWSGESCPYQQNHARCIYLHGDETAEMFDEQRGISFTKVQKILAMREAKQPSRALQRNGSSGDIKSSSSVSGATCIATGISGNSSNNINGCNSKYSNSLVTAYSSDERPSGQEPIRPYTTGHTPTVTTTSTDEGALESERQNKRYDGYWPAYLPPIGATRPHSDNAQVDIVIDEIHRAEKKSVVASEQQLHQPSLGTPRTSAATITTMCQNDSIPPRLVTRPRTIITRKAQTQVLSNLFSSPDKTRANRPASVSIPDLFSPSGTMPDIDVPFASEGLLDEWEDPCFNDIPQQEADTFLHRSAVSDHDIKVWFLDTENTATNKGLWQREEENNLSNIDCPSPKQTYATIRYRMTGLIAGLVSNIPATSDANQPASYYKLW
ncbi:hypothetical protein BX616_005613 [Lobosporangium transversale]|uniref:C3H1-type domain-containing protein n=1 Tax=Lobosporangium transversale TaxID=64571 RepID=A0A1Y2G7V3_9FUNG|nr:hypothetical protein BCR41DRAFT_401441 [Lobosporangium transversale]KAF9918803.1 hypothetical protein BX616_005613 [Lobosporangium transversale]ORZ01970.1 hypothetical protein BCR41DRAFT_401441 [Lobosporangium transversale]|eukprot:XP_021876223.1 hypothetical protein BCR41DRAFT_401441 [Lobosporangium transversale]